MNPANVRFLYCTKKKLPLQSSFLPGFFHCVSSADLFDRTPEKWYIVIVLRPCGHELSHVKANT